jgi:uncharacterized membrane protein YccC
LLQPPRLGQFRNSFIVREALRVAPGRPNFAAGLRAGLATVLPLLLIPLLGHPELMWASLAGFGAVLADKGGAYRTRALSMSAIAVASSLAVFLGTLTAGYPLLACLLVLAAVGLGAFVRLFGAEATSIGVLSSVSLVVALANPVPDVRGALVCAGFALLGTGWSALLSLVLWPLRPYRPARLASADSLRQLAVVARSLVSATTDPTAQVARRSQLGRAREAIERARAALGSSRRSRPGPSRRGEQLVALVEASDQLFGALTALEDGLALESYEQSELLREQLDRVAELIEDELTRLADAICDERALAYSAACQAALATIEPHVDTRTEHVPRLLLRAVERLERVIELGRAIDDPSLKPLSGRAEPSELSTEASKLSLMRDHLTLDSAMFRHALRTAIATASAVLFMHALHVEHGYWATLTCLVIMQPHGAATWAKALQRVLGTVIGAGVAVLIASLVHDPSVIVAFVFAFVTVGMALLPLNYGAFAVFLTPGFVLLAERNAGELDLAWVRVVDTLLGALIALLGSRLLFPLSERDQFRPLMDKAVLTLRGLLEVAAAPAPSNTQLRTARRQLGLALLNAEASYQRLLSESGLALEESEALLSLLLYAHRLASGLIALALAEGTQSHRRLIESAPELARAIDEVHQLIARRKLASAPPEPARRAVALGDRVDRLFDQLAILHGAAVRWNEHGHV